MKRHIGAIALAAMLASCGPASEPSPAPEPTPEELGQDDPDAPFEPAPVGPPKTYEAASTTAMSFTPGTLTFTPTPQQGVNLPPGATFAFGNGYTLETTLVPGGAGMGDKPFDFSPFYANADGTPADISTVEIYSVEKETVPPAATNGGFCDKTGFIAVQTVTSPGAEDFRIIAFKSDGWPAESEAAVCGTFNYSRVH